MSEPNILNRIHLPAGLNTEQTALSLGFAGHDIPVLIQARLLKLLGNLVTANIALGSSRPAVTLGPSPV